MDLFSARDVAAVSRAALVAGDGVGAAGRVLDVVRPVARFDSGGLVAWNPLRRGHDVVACRDYPPDVLRRLGDEFADTASFDRLVRIRRPLRVDDAPHDFRGTRFFTEVLNPAGYDDGLTLCLFTPDERYVGMLHMSAVSADSFDDHLVHLLTLLGPAFAQTTDLARGAAGPLGAGFGARLADATGTVVTLPGGPDRPYVLDDTALVHLVRRFLATGAVTEHGLWSADEGRWAELTLTRTDGTFPGAVVVAERPAGDLPYRLSPRELDVLTGLARGLTNQQIAAELHVSGRTIATHVEHVLAKLGGRTRTSAASRAIREGLLRLPAAWRNPR